MLDWFLLAFATIAYTQGWILIRLSTKRVCSRQLHGNMGPYNLWPMDSKTIFMSIQFLQEGFPQMISLNSLNLMTESVVAQKYIHRIPSDWCSFNFWHFLHLGKSTFGQFFDKIPFLPRKSLGIKTREDCLLLLQTLHSCLQQCGRF